MATIILSSSCPAAPDEGLALPVLVGARPLADEDQLGLRVPNSKDDVLSAFVKLAAPAVAELVADLRQGQSWDGGRGIEGQVGRRNDWGSRDGACRPHRGHDRRGDGPRDRRRFEGPGCHGDHWRRGHFADARIREPKQLVAEPSHDVRQLIHPRAPRLSRSRLESRRGPLYPTAWRVRTCVA